MTLPDDDMDLYHNKATLLKHLEYYGTETLVFLPYVSAKLQDDREVVLAFLKTNGMQLDLASDKYKDDEKVVAVAVAQNKNALQYASARLQKDYMEKFNG